MVAWFTPANRGVESACDYDSDEYVFNTQSGHWFAWNLETYQIKKLGPYVPSTWFLPTTRLGIIYISIVLNNIYI